MRGLKNIGMVLLGLAVVAGLILISVLFIEGAIWATVKLTPILETANELALCATVLLLIPASLKIGRGLSAVGYLVISYIFGITLWMFGLIVAYAIWGVVGIIVGLGFLGLGVVPVALIASLLHGEWYAIANLAFGIVLTFGTRAFAAFLAAKADRERDQALVRSEQLSRSA